MKIFLALGILAIGGTIYLLSQNNEEVTVVESDRPEVVGEDNVLPNDWPATVPMYPNSVVERVNDVAGDNGDRNITVSLKAEASVADVNTWYRGALNQNGWAVTSDRVVGGYVLLKGELDNIVVFMQAANHQEVGYVLITQRVQVKAVR